MFINIKLSKIFKIFFIIAVIIMMIFFGISVFQIHSKTTEKILTSSACEDRNNVVDVTAQNYTNVLKAVHENLDAYVGMKIHFTGFVYRVFDLTDTQFVLARNMVIGSDQKAVVVGFLCNCESAHQYSNSTWVEVTGTITKGNYHGAIPVLEITEIKNATTPADEFVYPPENSFVPTSAII